MALNNNPTFRISSALKNLIGKELITDEFIAIFELVKNSFDAQAKKATIIFENTSKKDARIIIVDDGKGMNYDDLTNKWLFVAYSAKREGLEDYRDKIKSKRVFAGAKGVGRFSCDRLGKKLNLISIKNTTGAHIENLEVDWEKFEKDANTEFINIETSFQRLKSISYKIKHGTILEISGLRDTWSRDRILKLKHSLEKLVNPNKENQTKDFEIEVICEEEKSQDKTKKEARDRVNGLIENVVFDKIENKTTKIESQISDDGKIITTKLTDRGSWIYTIKEHNEYITENIPLKSIFVKLFQLNRAAKRNFTIDMGMEPVKYGSVFMYKNNFRIYPFGEEGDDTLRIDRRKQQGFSRFLGTRDLLGRIEITGINKELVESTSRDGGLIKNDHYDSLLEYFYDKAFHRLENYVVDIIEWGDDRIFELEEKVNLPGLTPKDVKKEIIEYIKKISKAKNVISVEYDKKFISILEEKAGQSINKSLRELAKRAKNSKDPTAFKEAVKLKQEFKKITEDTRKAESKATKVEKELEKEIRLGLFQKSIIGREKKDLLSLQHQIRHTASSISWSLDKLVEAVNKGMSKEKLVEHIQSISLEVQKISSASQFVTKANFNTDATKINGDIVEFINDYAENVYKTADHFIHEKRPINIVIENKSNAKLDTKFRPLELTVIIDNLFTNSKTAGARNVSLSWKKGPSYTVLHFKDDGKGIADKIVDRVFDFGYSTTDGSGMGLAHIQQIVVENMKGEVSINNKLPKGVEFIIKFKK